MHLLWIARCDLVHGSLSGGDQIEQLLLLREEIEDILSDEDSCAECPQQLLKNLNPSFMISPEIRGWLFEYYTHAHETENMIR